MKHVKHVKKIIKKKKKSSRPRANYSLVLIRQISFSFPLNSAEKMCHKTNRGSFMSSTTEIVSNRRRIIIEWVLNYSRIHLTHDVTLETIA